MPKITALLRKPGPSFIRAISAHPEKDSIDYVRARAQHGNYAKALVSAGVKVEILDHQNDFPDSPFIEDTAVILERLALVCPMKENSRRGEAASVIPYLAQHRPVKVLEPPATMDGGDVLDTEKSIYLGISQRTNKEAVDALAKFSDKPIVPVLVKNGLHLKSSVSYLGKNLLVLDPASVETNALKGFDWIEVEKHEHYAANCLKIGDTVLMASGYPSLGGKIKSRGFRVMELEMSEFEKADGGVTCLSLIIQEVPV